MTAQLSPQGRVSRSVGSRRGLGPAVAVAFALLLAACGGSVEASSVRSLDYWAALDAAPAGEPWTTALATNQREVRELWSEYDLPGPVAAVDFSTDVVVYFGLPVTDECSLGSVEQIRYDGGSKRLYPVFENGVSGCSSDGEAHALVVTVAIDDLPSDAFQIWVDGAAPSSDLAGNATQVPAADAR